MQLENHSLNLSFSLGSTVFRLQRIVLESVVRPSLSTAMETDVLNFTMFSPAAAPSFPTALSIRQGPAPFT